MKLFLAKLFTFILTPLRLAMLLHFKLLAKAVIDKDGNKRELTLWLKLRVGEFVILDYISNWIFSGQFMDWPATKGELVTARLTRYKEQYAARYGNYWVPNKNLNPIAQHRLDWAIGICEKLSEYEGKIHC